MIRTSSSFSIMYLAWCATAFAADARDADAGVTGFESPRPNSQQPALVDPCAELDLSRIPGLTGTMIGRVYPAKFSQGDQVTVCGRGLTMTKFVENYQPEVGVALRAGNFIEIGDENSRLGWKVQVFGLATSATGGRVTFVIGGLYQSALHQRGVSNSNPGLDYFLVPAGRSGFRAAQESVRGELKLMIRGSGFAPPKAIGPVVTWHVGGPKPRHAYGSFFGKKEPFVITQQGNGQAISVELGLITIEGSNLDGGTYLIGDAPLKKVRGFNDDGSSVVVAVPQNAVSGNICASGAGQQTCAGAIAVQPSPNVTKSVQMPLQLRTSYVIEGTNLLPNVPELTYRLVMTGLTGDTNCAQVLKVKEHTANRIEFSLGDVSDKAPIPEICSVAANYKRPQENAANVIYLMARYRSQERPLYQLHYFIRPKSD